MTLMMTAVGFERRQFFLLSTVYCFKTFIIVASIVATSFSS
jgi:hypothetical protein